MNSLAHACSFHELLVYQKTRQLSQQIFQLSATFPKDEMFSLTSQIRRSSRSIGAQIAEAWAKRRYENHFISKLTDADSEQLETQHWIGTAVDCSYWNPETASPLTQQCAEIGRMLASMMDKASMFCGNLSRTVHEPSAEYFVTDSETADSDQRPVISDRR